MYSHMWGEGLVRSPSILAMLVANQLLDELPWHFVHTFRMNFNYFGDPVSLAPISGQTLNLFNTFWFLNKYLHQPQLYCFVLVSKRKRAKLRWWTWLRLYKLNLSVLAMSFWACWHAEVSISSKSCYDSKFFLLSALARLFTLKVVEVCYELNLFWKALRNLLFDKKSILLFSILIFSLSHFWLFTCSKKQTWGHNFTKLCFDFLIPYTLMAQLYDLTVFFPGGTNVVLFPLHSWTAAAPQGLWLMLPKISAPRRRDWRSLSPR